MRIIYTLLCHMFWPVEHSVEYASHVACRNSGTLTHSTYVAVSRSMWKVVEPWSHVFKAHWGLHLFFSYKLWLQLYLSLTSMILLGEPLSVGYLIRTTHYNTHDLSWWALIGNL